MKQAMKKELSFRLGKKFPTVREVETPSQFQEPTDPCRLCIKIITLSDRDAG
jgi:hypothetical protein